MIKKTNCYFKSLYYLKKYTINKGGSYRIEGPGPNTKFNFFLHKDGKEKFYDKIHGQRKRYLIGHNETCMVTCEFKDIEIVFPEKYIFRRPFNYLLLLLICMCFFFLIYLLSPQVLMDLKYKGIVKYLINALALK